MQIKCTHPGKIFFCYYLISFSNIIKYIKYWFNSHSNYLCDFHIYFFTFIRIGIVTRLLILIHFLLKHLFLDKNRRQWDKFNPNGSMLILSVLSLSINLLANCSQQRHYKYGDFLMKQIFENLFLQNFW